MSSLVFGITGAVIGSALTGGAAAPILFGMTGAQLGLAAGSLFGAVLDTTLLPIVFPKPDIKGPTLDSLQVTTASEGSPAAWVLGSKTPVGGTLMWVPRKSDGSVDFTRVKKKTKVGKGGGGQKVESEVIYVDVAFAISVTDTTGPVRRIPRVWAADKLIYDGQTTAYYESITFYYGDQSVPDPTIVAREGLAKTPIYKKICYCVIKGLALTEFGNGIPNMKFEVEQDADINLGEALGFVLQRAGIATDKYDVSRVAYKCFTGMNVSGPQRTAEVLQTLMLAYGVGARETDTVLEFFPRGQEDEVTLRVEDLGATDESGESFVPFESKDPTPRALPAHVIVRFIAVDNDLQRASVTAHRYEAHPSEDTLTVDLPMTLTHTQADAIAHRILDASDAERRKVTFTLPTRYLHLQEGDVGVFNYKDIDYRVYCGEVARGQNFALEVEGFLTDPAVFDQTGAQYSTRPSSGDGQPSQTVAIVFDGPALVDALCNTCGVYFAGCVEDPTQLWLGAQLFSSPDDVAYTSVGDAAIQATIGEVESPPGAGPEHLWDDASTIEVLLYSGSLASCTEDECLAGENRCAIQHPNGEWEIIGFQLAVATSANRYTLSKLLRGLRGTEHLIEGHLPDARFLLLDTDSSVSFYDAGIPSFGSDNYYKLPMVGGLVSDYTAQQVAIAGRTMKPFAVAHLEAAYQANDDLLITWTRRGKRFASKIGSTPLATDEVPETYEVDLRFGGEAAPVIRTLIATGPTATYTSAQQSDDGVSPGLAPVHITVYQMSTAVGRGYPKVTTVEI